MLYSTKRKKAEWKLFKAKVIVPARTVFNSETKEIIVNV